MKPTHLLIVVATITVFLATFIISNGLPTGFLTAFEQPINLQLGNVQVYDTKATISWTTEARTFSVLGINDEQVAFPEASRFSKDVTGLNPGASYEYRIRACDSETCEEISSTIVTKTAPVEITASLITGAVTGLDGITKVLRASVNLILYGLIGIIVLVILTRIGYERFSAGNQMAGMVNKTKKFIENEQYDEANKTYAQARQAFLELEEEAKLKNYDGLLKIYHSLKKHMELREAQRLAEKYSDGTITQEELRSLNDLIVR